MEGAAHAPRFTLWACGHLGRAGRSPPASGANSTATIQLTSQRHRDHDEQSEKVNSPAEAELFNPIGMKPATVTSVPVSIGKAIEVHA